MKLFTVTTLAAAVLALATTMSVSQPVVDVELAALSSGFNGTNADACFNGAQCFGVQ